MPGKRANAARDALPISGGVLLGCLALLLLACGGGGGSPRPPLAELAFPDAHPSPGAVHLEPAFPGLTFVRPVFLTTAPDLRREADERPWVLVVEQDGRVLIFENDAAVSTATTFIDLRAGVGGPVVRDHNEEGLQGFAVDPDFDVNGRVYLHFSAADETDTSRSVLARFTATFPTDPAQPPTVSLDTELVLLELGQPSPWHHGGMLGFGPDGCLYASFGDGGPSESAQDLSTLLGSMIRIDVRASSTDERYRVPDDNPFVDDPDARDEIWACGLRNPWRWSFDRGTGDLWLGDVGQDEIEELNRVVRGGNYGWCPYEGSRENDNPDALPATAFEPPVFEYDRALGDAVIGGYVYRGQAVPTIHGAYVYGDYASGRVFGLVPNDDGYSANTDIAHVPALVSFGEDERGELYALSLDGPILRIVEPAAAPPPVLPGTLSATGLFTDFATLTPAQGLVEYDVAAPFWSDGSIKRRWIGIPDDARIGFEPDAPWRFPVGTVAVKHFELELVAGDPTSARRLETRVLIHYPNGWAGLTYRWRDPVDGVQADADLLGDALKEWISVEDAEGPRDQTWCYPSRTQCLECHTPAAGSLLGVRTGQIHRDAPDGESPLDAWNALAFFDLDIGASDAYDAWPDPTDETLPLESRARAYLATNCAQCHRPGGPAPGELDLRYATPTDQMGAIGVGSRDADVALWIVDPGRRESSALYVRMTTLGPARMPRIGSTHVDADGAELIGRWIDGLAP